MQLCNFHDGIIYVAFYLSICMSGLHQKSLESNSYLRNFYMLLKCISLHLNSASCLVHLSDRTEMCLPVEHQFLFSPAVELDPGSLFGHIYLTENPTGVLGQPRQLIVQHPRLKSYQTSPQKLLETCQTFVQNCP